MKKNNYSFSSVQKDYDRKFRKKIILNILLYCIIFCSSLGLYAQVDPVPTPKPKPTHTPKAPSSSKKTIEQIHGQLNNPKRTVLFALAPHEVLYYDENEYFASLRLDQKRFICIVEDTLNKIHTIVYNGKRIHTVKMSKSRYGFYQNTINLFYFDPRVENAYGFSYDLAGRTFINIAGKTIHHVNNHPEICSFNNGKIIFSYYYNGNYYIYTNGYVYLDGKIFGAYKQVYNLKITETGVYGFEYWIGNERYFHVNGKDNVSFSDFVNIPDNSYDDLFFDDSGVLELSSSDNKHKFFSNYEYEYVVIDGQMFGISPALQAIYDIEKNAFIWSTMEKKELVVYEYKLR